MKRFFAMMLTLLFLLSLLAGCKPSTQNAAPEETDNTETTAGQTAAATEISPEAVEVTVPKEIGITGAGESDIVIAATGKLRMTYSGNVSSVRYITDPSQLPDHEELKGYDEAYFREHALILVMETVTSGTVQVDISGVTVEDGTAAVQLSHEAQGDLGTTVMTTWLLWAEVEAGLDYKWTVENPAVKSEAERY